MLYAVIMAGGSGTRFWPKSRRQSPKQFLRLFGETTMIQQTAGRIAPMVDPSRLLVVTGLDQAESARAQLADVPAANILAEPAPRDTAACVGLAAGVVAARDPEAVMIVMPADHVIEPQARFLETVEDAVSLIQAEPLSLVTFGIRPTRPETGYGYIEQGDEFVMPSGRIGRCVAQFREKPNLETARSFLDSGRFLWNSGIFVWRARTILDEIKAHRPGLHEGLAPILAHADSPSFGQVLAERFPQLERVPIDRAVLERSAHVKVIEAPYQWSDVGDWRALAELLELDSAGNAVFGRTLTHGSTGSIFISEEGGLVAALGVEDLVVVQSQGAVLVARKERLDELKALVEGLGKAGLQAFS